MTWGSAPAPRVGKSRSSPPQLGRACRECCPIRAIGHPEDASSHRVRADRRTHGLKGPLLFACRPRHRAGGRAAPRAHERSHAWNGGDDGSLAVRTRGTSGGCIHELSSPAAIIGRWWLRDRFVLPPTKGSVPWFFISFVNSLPSNWPRSSATSSRAR